MEDDTGKAKPEWKKLVKLRVTETAHAWKQPCFIHFVSITADPAGPATAIIRDGNNGSAQQLLNMTAQASDMTPLRFKPPLYFERGVHIEIGSNVTSVFLHLETEN